jgi:hypothetical protein
MKRKGPWGFKLTTLLSEAFHKGPIGAFWGRS